jgi:hypothetical protein
MFFGMAPFAKCLAFGVAVFPRLTAAYVVFVMNLKNDTIGSGRAITSRAMSAVKLNNLGSKLNPIAMEIEIRQISFSLQYWKCVI